MLKTIYIIEIIVDSILYTNLLFLLIIGLFFVSAGEKIAIRIIIGIEIIIFNLSSITKYLHMSGHPINIIVDDIKQTMLFFACNPNDTDLIILNSNKSIINSFIIPMKYAIIKIIIAFVIVKYVPSSPYRIAASFLSSYSGYFFCMIDIDLSNMNFFNLITSCLYSY